MKTKCKLRGGTRREAVVAILKCLVPGHRHEWYAYECDCGLWHVTDNPT